MARLECGGEKYLMRYVCLGLARQFGLANVSVLS